MLENKSTFKTWNKVYSFHWKNKAKWLLEQMKRISPGRTKLRECDLAPSLGRASLFGHQIDGGSLNSSLLIHHHYVHQ